MFFVHLAALKKLCVNHAAPKQPGAFCMTVVLNLFHPGDCYS